MNKRIISLTIIAGTVCSFFVGFIVLNSSASNDVIYHHVTFNTNSGSEITPITVIDGGKIPKPDSPTKDGYTFNIWTLGETEEWDFDNFVVSNDITLNAQWNVATYKIEYDFNGGHSAEQLPTNYTIFSSFDLPKIYKDYNVFTGWFSNDKKRIDSIKPGMFGNLFLTASWSNNLIAISEDESKGLIDVYVSETNPNEYTVINSPINNKHHLFKGWYNNNGDLLSTNPEHTVIVNPNESFYIYSKYMDDQEEAEWNVAHGVVPYINNDTVVYGMYPQTNVNNELLLDILNDLKPTKYNGYYYYDHEYYVKKVAKLARDLNTHELLSVRQFDNGDEFVEDETYWFKVEPLSWKILEQSNSEYTLLSEKLLEVTQYHGTSSTRTIDEKTIYANNYKYSDIREWLNNDFMSTTFTFNKSNLSIVEVDNSKESTATPDSGFECENTFDYVTLLSYREYDEQSILDRQIKTTDYVRVSGANYSVNENNLFSGYYWTRSPIESEEEDKNGTAASRCNMNGTLNSDYVGWGGSCIQPSIKINK